MYLQYQGTHLWQTVRCSKTLTRSTLNFHVRIKLFYPPKRRRHGSSPSPLALIPCISLHQIALDTIDGPNSIGPVDPALHARPTAPSASRAHHQLQLMRVCHAHKKLQPFAPRQRRHNVGLRFQVFDRQQNIRILVTFCIGGVEHSARMGRNALEKLACRVIHGHLVHEIIKQIHCVVERWEKIWPHTRRLLRNLARNPHAGGVALRGQLPLKLMERALDIVFDIARPGLLSSCWSWPRLDFSILNVHSANFFFFGFESTHLACRVQPKRTQVEAQY